MKRDLKSVNSSFVLYLKKKGYQKILPTRPRRGPGNAVDCWTLVGITTIHIFAEFRVHCPVCHNSRLALRANVVPDPISFKILFL